jgi:hypothetical protein
LLNVNIRLRQLKFNFFQETAMIRDRKAQAASLLFGMVFAGFVMGADSPGVRPSRETSQISGTVESYNLDPHGTVNGIIIKDGDHVSQLNLPPDQGASVAAAAPLGQKIEATGMSERANGDHAIYRLASLTGVDGKQVTISGPEDGAATHVEGTVKSLNYTPRGDVDGAILDSGDFLQMGPGAAEEAGLKVGEKITADGHARPMVAGHQIISATMVNGTEVRRPPHGRPGPGGRGPGGPEGDRGPGGGDRGMDGPPPGQDGK